MLGCPGAVSFADKASLCGPGFSPCSVDQWMSRRAGQVPHHHYWTIDDFKIVFTSRDGLTNSCYYSKSYGRLCYPPAHICADVSTDPEGNSCDNRNCGRFDPVPPPNDFFGGARDFTAGSLCCCAASGVSCATGAPVDTFSDGMFGCAGIVSWMQRASLLSLIHI